MKKKIGLAIGAVAAAGILGLGVFHSSASQTEPSMSAGEIEQKVTKQYPGEITDVKQGTEFKHAVYQVKITGDKKEYSLKLDGDNGDVLDIKEKPIKKEQAKKEADKKQSDKKSADKSDKKDKQKDKAEKKQEQTNEKEPKSESKKAVISTKEAGEIALKEFSGEIDEIELEEEDGRLIYEVEIERGEQEAEIEIDAYTGEIIVIEIEED